MRVIKTKIGSGNLSDPDDMYRVKSLFQNMGLYNQDIVSPYFDSELQSAIKKFQFDNDLVVDGQMMPDGETEKALVSAMVRSPIIRCPICGGPHGGSQGDICPDCTVKQ